MSKARVDEAVTVELPRPFGFRGMVLSHGWRDLPPFEWDDAREGLRTTFRVGTRAVTLDLTGPNGGAEKGLLRAGIVAGGPLGPKERARVAERLRWMFRLGEDFRPFHAACRRRRELGWVVRDRLGPFLRNPTLFEELAKILLTTNVNWGGTRTMARRLIELYGTPVGSDAESVPPARAFPEPAVLAGRSESELRREARVGYRAPFLLRLAEKAASGALDEGALLDPKRPTEDLAREIGRLDGFGPYATNAALLSLGRYDRLVLDSWIRGTVARIHFRSPRVTDRSIERRYAPWGEWKTLACWFDCAWETWMRDALARGAAPNAAPGAGRLS